jgi:tetratricopeptide (TPR) repeat protein
MKIPMLGAALLASFTFLVQPASAQTTPLQQAQAAFDADRFEDAERILKPLAGSADARVQILRGRVAMERHDYDTAATALEKAAETQPKNADIHFYLGETYGSQAITAGTFSQVMLARKAKSELELAVELNPNHLDARIGLMQFYLQAPGIVGGSEEKAFAQAAEIAKRDRFQGHRARASIFARQKKSELARLEFVAAVKEEPTSARAHTGLASIYGNLEKNYKAANEELATAIKLDPTYMPAWFRVGQIAAASGAGLADGEQALRKYLTYYPKDNEPGLASAWYYLGMIFEKQGKKADAKLAYNNALKGAPKDKNVLEALKRVG